jgi:predicted thioesterase
VQKLEPLAIGATGTASLVVEEAHTAAAVGSGLEHVLATPVMIALMEAAAVDCVEHRLEPGTTSLGIRIAVDHIAPTVVGAEISARAELRAVTPKRLTFAVTAQQGETIIGSGTHERAIVNVAEFRRRLSTTAG